MYDSHHVSLREHPEFISILNKASGYKKSGECEIRIFPENGLELNLIYGGGTRYTYTLINMGNNEVMNIQNEVPDFRMATPVIQKLPENFCLVECCIFQGKPLFPRIYLNKVNVNKMIEEERIELNSEESSFLKSYRTLKSSYRPKNETILNSLKGKGLIAKNNSVTIKGKNWKE